MSPIYQKLIRITLAIPGFWVLILNSTLALPKNSQEVIPIKNSQFPTTPEIADSSVAQIMLTDDATDASESGDEIRGNESESILSQALEIANSIKDPQRKANVLSDVALQYAAIGQMSKATLILDQAKVTAQAIEDTPQQISVIGSIAVKYDSIGSREKTVEILSESLAQIQAIEDAETQASLFIEIALKYAEIGQSEQAKELLVRSQQATARAEVPVPNFPFQPTPLAGDLTVGTRVFSGLSSENSLDINVNLAQQFATDSLA